MAVIYCVVVESPEQIIGTNEDRNQQEKVDLGHRKGKLQKFHRKLSVI
jgi:hypothetical protein